MGKSAAYKGPRCGSHGGSCFAAGLAIAWVLVGGFNLLLSGSIAFPLASLAAQAEPNYINIGVSELPKELNVLKSKEPAAGLVRAGLTASLLRVEPAAGRGFDLWVADSVRFFPGEERWLFRVRAAMRFVNGSFVGAEDVTESLRRCLDEGQLSGVSSISSIPREHELDAREWVEIKWQESGSAESAEVTSEEYNKHLNELAACPILEAQSSRIFGSALGFGSNLVSAGWYRITHYQAQQEFRLAPVEPDTANASSVAGITIKRYGRSAEALSSLRVGGLDAILSPDSDSLAKALSDETLRVGKCDAFDVIMRQNLQLRCEPAIDLRDLRYAG